MIGARRAAALAALLLACACSSSEESAGTYAARVEVAPWSDPTVAVELDEGCGELGPKEQMMLHGQGHEVVLLPTGCTFRVRIDAPAGGKITAEVALHPYDVKQIATGGLAAPELVLGVERSSDLRERRCIDFESNLLSDTGWRKRTIEFEGDSDLVVVGRIEPTARGRRHARVAIGSLVIETRREEPYPLAAGALPPMPDEFASRAPADVDADAIWRRWARNRAALSSALAPGGVSSSRPDSARVQAVFAAAADQEQSFGEFTRDHPEATFWQLWKLVPGEGDAGPGGRPDLVLIVIDCARRDHLSAYGYPRATTPSIDALLAERGLLFTQAYSTGSATNYSMPSMMTGLYPTQHRFPRRMVLAGGETTLAERLRDAGYLTLGVATNPFLGPGSGLDQGFFVYDSREREYNPYPRAESAVARAEELSVALRWLPTFLYVHVMDAHGPYRPGPPFDRAFDDVPYGEADELRNRRASPPFLANETFRKPAGERPAYVGVERLETLYDASLGYVDHHLGRLLESLEARGLLRSAAVFLTADHGEEFFEHDLTYHDSVPHEEKLRVPLIVKPPAGAGAQGQAQVPRRIDRPVDAVLGVMPTLLELAGAPVPDELRSMSVLGEGAPGPMFHDNGWIRAVRDGSWKLIVADAQGQKFPEYRLRGDPPEMLFRLDVDPGEKVNLSDREPEKAAELRALLDRRFAPLAAEASAADAASGAVPAEASSPEDVKRRDRLRALGYAE
jgi:arylsulfatase A-like enzyme